MDSTGAAPNKVLLTKVIQAYCKLGDLRAAMQVFQDIGNKYGLVPDTFAFNIILNAHARNGDVQTVLSLLDDMRCANLRPDAVSHCAVIQAFSRNGQALEARAWLEKVAGGADGCSQINEFCINGVLSALVKDSRHHQDAADFFESVERTYGVKRSMIGYNLMMSMAAGDRGTASIESCEYWFNHMLQNQVSPSIVTFNTCLKAVANMQVVDTNKAFQLLHQMDRFKMHGDAITYSTLIEIFAKANRPADAVFWFRKMQERMPVNDFALCRVVDAFSISGDAKNARLWFAKLHTRDIVTYNTLLKVYAHTEANSTNSEAIETSEDLEACKVILSEMSEDRIAPNLITVDILLSVAAKRRDITHAESFFRLCNDFHIKPSVDIFQKLVSIALSTNDETAALHWYHAMIQHGVQPTTEFFNVVLHVFAQEGNLARIDFWRGIMQSTCVIPSDVTFNILLNACSRAEDSKRLDEYLQEMQKMSISLDERSYLAVISTYGRCGDPQTAAGWFETMLSARIQPNVELFGAVIHSYAANGDLLSAQKYQYF